MTPITGPELREWRAHWGVTIRELAEASSVSHDTISKYENDYAKMRKNGLTRVMDAMQELVGPEAYTPLRELRKRDLQAQMGDVLLRLDMLRGFVESEVQMIQNMLTDICEKAK